jgi:hypothetical protein
MGWMLLKSKKIKKSGNAIKWLSASPYADLD